MFDVPHNAVFTVNTILNVHVGGWTAEFYIIASNDTKQTKAGLITNFKGFKD